MCVMRTRKSCHDIRSEWNFILTFNIMQDTYEMPWHKIRINFIPKILKKCIMWKWFIDYWNYWIKYLIECSLIKLLFVYFRNHSTSPFEHNLPLQKFHQQLKCCFKIYKFKSYSFICIVNFNVYFTFSIAPSKLIYSFKHMSVPSFQQSLNIGSEAKKWR
jgi:hypothetical protein